MTAMDQRAACESEIVELSREEAAEAFDAVARHEMGISGPEFIRRWDAGEFADRKMDEINGLVATWTAMALVR